MGLCLLVAFAAHLYFFAMLGLFLSVICRKTITAYLGVAGVLMLLLFGTVAVLMLLNLRSSEDIWLRVVNPVGCWITISVEWWLRGNSWSMEEIFFGLVGYFVAGTMLRVAAYRRFGRLNRR